MEIGSQSELDAGHPLTSTTLRGGPGEIAVQSFGMTDVGRARQVNEDHFLVAELSRLIQIRQSSLAQPAERVSQQRGHLWLVADGMGGHAAGEKASAMAVFTIEDFLLNTLRWFLRLRGESVLVEFQEALRAADARLVAAGEQSPELKGMGTTLTMGYMVNQTLYIAHVGDSRCYLARGDRLHQVTRDHSLVADLVEKGAITPEEAASHRLRNVITNVVGGNDAGVRVEVHKIALEPGDIMMLCSDGLTNMVDDERIATVLREQQETETACRTLISLANEAGGKDNITVVVARFEAALAPAG